MSASKSIASAGIIAFLSCLFIAPSFAATIVNGDFETGNLSAWSTTGNATVQDQSFGTLPASGSFQALLSNDGSTQSASSLESFLGLTSGSIALTGSGIPIEGSAFKQTIVANAGDVLTFQWNFLTNELTPPTSNDFAFFTIGNSIRELADTTTSLFATSPSISFNDETGYRTFSMTVTNSGTFTLGFGVVDVSDRSIASGLLIDNATLVPVPEPSSVGSAFVGIAILFARLRRRWMKDE